MGQYLAIGIVTECGTEKKNLEKYKITKEDLIAELKTKLHFEPAIYDFSETATHYLFQLKSSIFENELVPFLEKFYPFLYSDKEEFMDALKKISASNSSEWLKLAEKRSYSEFQIDKYGESDYIYFDKPFKPSANIFSTSIMLSAEGKIMMESYGRQFQFFKYCIQQTFPEFEIAKAIRVYITG